MASRTSGRMFHASFRWPNSISDGIARSNFPVRDFGSDCNRSASRTTEPSSVFSTKSFPAAFNAPCAVKYRGRYASRKTPSLRSASRKRYAVNANHLGCLLCAVDTIHAINL